MNSLVQELQKDLSKPDIKMTDILRKAYILSKKLQIYDFEKWLNKELNGYNDNDQIPEYRKVQGFLTGYNPLYGMVPVICPDRKVERILNTNKLRQSISELENLILSSNGKGLSIFIPDEMSHHFGIETKVVLNISTSQIVKIIESVKNIILEWMLTLENDGIIGINWDFSIEEKKIVEGKNYIVNNFYGDINDTQFQQNSDNSNQTYQKNDENLKLLTEIIDLITNNMANIELTKENSELIIQEISKINDQLQSKKPKKDIINKSIISIKTILEGVSSNLIAGGLIHHIDKLLCS